MSVAMDFWKLGYENVKWIDLTDDSVLQHGVSQLAVPALLAAGLN
jgi:hypothetical protein